MRVIVAYKKCLSCPTVCSVFVNPASLDPSFDKADDEQRIMSRATNAKLGRTARLHSRLIFHDSYKNGCTSQKAHKILCDSTVPIGRAIFRPARVGETTKNGKSCLKLTWKDASNHVRHEIIEEHGEFDADHGIGNMLLIRERKYHDLDEIIVRHVQPLARFLEKMYAFRNYNNKVVSKEGEFWRPENA